MTIVRTDLGDTREVAKRLRFEPTPDNAATNVQDAIELASAGGGGGGSAPDPVTLTSAGAIDPGVVTVNVNAPGPITLVLPNSVTWAAANNEHGVPLSVFDVSGGAAGSPVTLQGDAELINGLASVDIASNFGGYRFRPNPLGGWTIA